MHLERASAERKGFLGHLRSDPGFFLRHVPAIADAVFRRLRTKLIVRFSRPHLGRKIRPRWLKLRWLPGESPVQAAAGLLTLPAYVCRLSNMPPATGSMPDTAGTAVDPEDYLAGHRWGFLVDSVLAGNADWKLDLARCTGWVAQHRGRADAAWEPYSTCERAANLLVFLAVLRATTAVHEVPHSLVVFLRDSLDWVVEHLEYYGPRATNNHIINNARAIVMAGVALNDARAIEAGQQLFHHCLPELILENGFLRERSSHYQVIVLNWIIDAWWFLKAREQSVAGECEFLGGYVRRMIAATTMLCDPDARLAAVIGDVSPDLPPATSLLRLKLLYPKFWPASGQLQAGVRMADGWFRIDADESIVLGNFPPGSFPAKFPTHGHADLTSFVWTRHGREILVDRGRYRYTPDSVSVFQTLASGHNLPLVNGFAPLCESLSPFATWLPLPYAAARLEAEIASASVVLAHDGFARATPVTRHTRRLTLKGHTLCIEDRFAGSGSIELTLCWHFGEGFDAFDPLPMAVNGSGGRIVIKVTEALGAPRTAITHAGHELGWSSPVYGHKKASLGIYLSWRIELPSQVTTSFAFA